MEINTYVCKPVAIEATQYFENKIQTVDAFWEWMTADCEFDDSDGLVNDLRIKTIEGEMHVSDGDWIIKGTMGEFYPCKPKAFENKYEIKN